MGFSEIRITSSFNFHEHHQLIEAEAKKLIDAEESKEIEQSIITSKTDEKSFIQAHSIIRTPKDLENIDITPQTISRKRSLSDSSDKEKIDAVTNPFKMAALVLCDKDLFDSTLQGEVFHHLVQNFCSHLKKNPKLIDGILNPSIIDTLNKSKEILDPEALPLDQGVVCYLKSFFKMLSLYNKGEDESDARKAVKELLVNEDFQNIILNNFLDFCTFPTLSLNLLYQQPQLIKLIIKEIEEIDEAELLRKYPSFKDKDIKQLLQAAFEELDNDGRVTSQKRSFLILGEKTIDSIKSCASKIKSELMKLEIDEELIYLGGYYDLPYSHAILYLFKKINHETFDFTIINTGSGTENHLIYQINHKIYIHPVLCFQNIPSIYLIGDLNEPEFGFMNELLKFQSEYFYLLLRSQGKPPSKAFYEFICSYLHPYKKIYQNESIGLIRPQTSGTCSFRAIKALIWHKMSDKSHYKKWILSLKTSVLVDANRLLQSTSFKNDNFALNLEITLNAAKNLISKIHKDLKLQKITEADSALATAIDIYQECVKIKRKKPYRSLIQDQKQFPKAPVSLESVSKNQGDLDLLSEINFDSIPDFKDTPPASTNFIYSHLKKLHCHESNIYDDLSKICSKSSGSIHFRSAFIDYIFNLPFPKDWTTKPNNPDKIIDLMVFGVCKIHTQFDTQTFVCMWKAFLICFHLSVETHPFLKDFQIGDFGLNSRQQLLGYLKCDLLIEKQLKSCVDQVVAFNKQAKYFFNNPLFSSLLEFSIPYEKNPQKFQKDGTIALYQYLTNHSPELHNELYNDLENYEYNKITALKPLVLDFGMPKGIFVRYNFHEIAILKKMAVWLEQQCKGCIVSLENSNLSNSQYRIEGSNLILKIPFETQDNCLDYKIDPSLTTSLKQLFTATNHKKITTDSFELDWSSISSDSIEGYLIEKKEMILSNFKFNRLEKEFIFNLILASAQNHQHQYRLLEIFSEKKYLHLTIKNSSIRELFKFTFFSSRENDPFGESILKKIKSDEIFRTLCEEFFEEFILQNGSWIKENQDIKTFANILSFAFILKIQAEPFVPFLPELRNLILNSCKNEPTLQTILYQYDSFFRSDKTSLDFFIFSLISLINDSITLKMNPYEIKKMIRFHMDSINCSKVLKGLEPYVLKKFEKELSGVENFKTTIDSQTMIYWIDIDEQTSFGFGLPNQKRYVKSSGITSCLNNNIEIETSYFIQSLFDRYPFCIEHVEKDIYYYFTPFGQFIEKEDMHFCKFSDATNLKIPDNLKNTVWALVTDLVTETYIAKMPEKFTNGVLRKLNIPIPADKILKNITALSDLPFEIFDICQIFYAEDANNQYFVTIDSEFEPQFLITLSRTDYEVLDLANGSQIQFLDASHPFQALFPEQKFMVEEFDGYSKLTCWDKTKECICFIQEGDSLKIEQKPDYILSDNIPEILLPHGKGMAFENHLKDKMIFISPTFYQKIDFVNPKEGVSLGYTSFFFYTIENNTLKFCSLKGRFYFVYLMILNRSEKVFEEIDGLMTDIALSIEPDDVKFIESTIDFLALSSKSYGILIKPTLTLIAKTVATLTKSKIKLGMDLKKLGSALKDYFNLSDSLPQIARLTAEEFESISQIANLDYGYIFQDRTRTIQRFEFCKYEEKSKIAPIQRIPIHHSNAQLRISNQEIIRSFDRSTFLLSPLNHSENPIDSESDIDAILDKFIRNLNAIDNKAEKYRYFCSICMSYASINTTLFTRDLALFAIISSQSEIINLMQLRDKNHQQRKSIISNPQNFEILKNFYVASIKPCIEAKDCTLKWSTAPNENFQLISYSARKKVPIITYELNFEINHWNTIACTHLNRLNLTALSQKIQTLVQLLNPFLNNDLQRSNFVSESDAFNTSLNTIVDSLEKIASLKEKNFFQLISTVQLPKQEIKKEDFPVLLAKKYSSRTTQHSIDALFHYILEENPIALTTVLDRYRPKEYSLDMSAYEVLDRLLIEILILHLEIRKLKNLKEFSHPHSIEKITADLRSIILGDRSYNYQDRHLILFEYFSNFIISPKQLEVYKKMTEIKNNSYRSQVAQVMMGGGKTSVIATLLSATKSSSKSINIFLTPSSQLESVKTLLSRNLLQFFKYEVFHLEFKRTDLTIERIISIKTQLMKAIKSQMLVISTPETMQSLQLEYLDEIRLHRDSSKKAPYLSDILNILMNYGDCIVDEFAEVADVSKMTNFPIVDHGQIQHKISSEQIQLYKTIFTFLTSNSIKCGDRSIAEITRIHLNEQMLLSYSEWELLIPYLADVVSDVILKIYPGFSTKKTLTAILRDKEISSETATFFKEHSDTPQVQLSALAHFTIHVLLIKSFKKCGGRNYGRDFSTGKIIPYLGVGSPATTEFGFLFETLTFHFCQAAQFGIEAQQIINLQQTLLKKVSLLTQSMQLSIDQTLEGIRFYDLTGLKLSQDSKKIELFEKAADLINEKRKELNFEKIFEIESYTCSEFIGAYPKYLGSNPHNLFSQFRSVRGLTGTPWNHLTYSQVFQNHISLDAEVETKIEQTFLSKPLVQGLTSYIFETIHSNPCQLLESVFHQLPIEERSKVQCIIDTGGLFKDYKNDQVARLILSFLMKIYPDNKAISVIYFGKEKDSNLYNIPTALISTNQGEFDDVTLSDLSTHSLLDKEIQPEHLFVYYDERHTIGTDIKLNPDAIGLITLDEKTPLHKFNQGLLRLRDYFKLQNTITIIPSIIQDALERRLETGQDLVNFLKLNQKNLISSLLFKSFKQQIINLFRKNAIDILLKDKGSSYEFFCPLIENIEDFDFVKLTTSVSTTLSPIEQLIEFGNHYSKTYIECLQKRPDIEFQSKIENTKRLIEVALNSIYTAAKSQLEYLNNEIDSLNQEVTIEQAISIAKETQHLQRAIVDISVQQESILSKAISSVPIANEKKLDFQSMIEHFSKSSATFISKDLVIGTLTEIFQSKSEIDTFHPIFENLYFTENPLYYFSDKLEKSSSDKRKKIQSCLVILSLVDPSKITTIGLTNCETIEAIHHLTKNPYPFCFLLNKKNQLILPNLNYLVLKNEKYAEHIDTSLLELLVFNNDIESLYTMPQKAYTWLNDSKLMTSSSTETPIGKLRQQYIKLCIAQRNCYDLMPLLEGLTKGEYCQHDLKDNIESTICQLKGLFDSGNKKELTQRLSSIRKDYIYSIPFDLVPYLPLNRLKHLSQVESLERVPPEKLNHLKSYQLSVLGGRINLFQLIQEQYRKDLAPLFSKNPQFKPLINNVLKISDCFQNYSTPIVNYQNIPGLPNLGNTCFINSALKALFAFPDLKSLIVNASLNHGDPSDETYLHRVQLQEGLLALHEDYLNKSPSLHKQLVTLLNNPLLSVLDPFEKQGDPDEVLKILFQALGLNDHLSMSIGIKGHLMPIIPLNFIYEGQKSTPFTALIDQALADEYGFIHPDYSQLKTIGIQLPRFTLDSAQRPMRNNQLFFHLLSPTIIPLKHEEHLIKLKLTARSLICHSGNLHSGHYRTFEKRDDQWILHDDATVSTVKKEELLKISIEAFLVFFDVEVI